MDGHLSGLDLWPDRASLRATGEVKPALGNLTTPFRSTSDIEGQSEGVTSLMAVGTSVLLTNPFRVHGLFRRTARFPFPGRRPPVHGPKRFFPECRARSWGDADSLVPVGRRIRDRAALVRATVQQP